MSEIIVGIGAFGLAIFIWIFVTTLTDMIHSFFGKTIMSVAGYFAGWDTSTYSLEGTFFTASFWQLILSLTLAVINYCVSSHGAQIPVEAQILLVVSLDAVILFGGGICAVQKQTFFKCVVSGFASLVAIPVALMVIVVPLAVKLAGIASH